MHRQQNSDYNILYFPIDYNKSYLDFTKDEIQNFRKWFLDIKEERLNKLSKFLFTDFENCLKEESLPVIEIFLVNSVSTVPKPRHQYDDEMSTIPLHLRSITQPDDYLLDAKTISICYDIGIFMGDLIIKLDNKISWHLETDNQYADYGQMVLSKKKNKLTLNPFRVVKNTAARIHEGTYPDKGLISIFKAWKKGFSNESN